MPTQIARGGDVVGVVVDEHHAVGRQAEAGGGQVENRRIGLDQPFHPRHHDVAHVVEHREGRAEQREGLVTEIGDRILRHGACRQPFDQCVRAGDRAGQRIEPVRGIARDQLGVFGMRGAALGNEVGHRDAFVVARVPGFVDDLCGEMRVFGGVGNHAAPDAREIPLHQHAADVPDDGVNPGVHPIGFHKRPNPRRRAGESASRTGQRPMAGRSRNQPWRALKRRWVLLIT